MYGSNFAGNLTLSPGMTRDVALYGLRQRCGDYSLRLVAVTGEEFSNEVEVVFNTCDTNSTETGGDVAMDYNIGEEEEACVAPVTQCVRPEPRQARDSAIGRADTPTVTSLVIQICTVLLIANFV